MQHRCQSQRKVSLGLNSWKVCPFFRLFSRNGKEFRIDSSAFLRLKPHTLRANVCVLPPAVVIIKGRQRHIQHTQTYHTTQKWCLPASCLPMFSSSFEKRGSPSSRPVCPTALPPLTAFRSASQTAWRLLARTERRESHIRRGTLQLALCVIFTYNWKYLSYICWGGVGKRQLSFYGL